MHNNGSTRGLACEMMFGNVSVVPETEGIKYTGSKLKILPYIINIILLLYAHILQTKTIFQPCPYE